MDTTDRISNLKRAIDALPLKQRRSLYRYLKAKLEPKPSLLPARRSKSKPSQHSLLELRGLGKAVWADVNAEDYIDNMRKWD